MGLQQVLQFPAALQGLRCQRARSQKALALNMGIDQAHLCGVEKGRRPPFSDDVIARLAPFLDLSAAHVDGLLWSAKHDRCVRFVWDTTGSIEEARLVSQVLSAARQLNAGQRSGLSAYLDSVQASARQMASLSSQGMGWPTLVAEQVEGDAMA